ncbi:MAG: hypothetical protein Kow0089_17310 [Desulfobulbaceae bacterium]
MSGCDRPLPDTPKGAPRSFDKLRMREVWLDRPVQSLPKPVTPSMPKLLIPGVSKPVILSLSKDERTCRKASIYTMVKDIEAP